MDAMTIEPEVSYNLDSSQVARYFLALDAQRDEPDVTALKLQKLLYLAQANYLASTGHRLFNDNVEAFEHGPVVYSVFREYRSYKKSIIAPSVAYIDSPELARDARDFIDQVWELYKDCTASWLRALTHRQAPWKDNYEPDSFRAQIPDAEMKDYFRHEVPLESRVFHPDVVVIDQAFLDDLDHDEDEIVAQAIAALR